MDPVDGGWSPSESRSDKCPLNLFVGPSLFTREVSPTWIYDSSPAIHLDLVHSMPEQSRMKINIPNPAARTRLWGKQTVAPSYVYV